MFLLFVSADHDFERGFRVVLSSGSGKLKTNTVFVGGFLSALLTMRFLFLLVYGGFSPTYFGFLVRDHRARVAGRRGDDESSSQQEPEVLSPSVREQELLPSVTDTQTRLFFVKQKLKIAWHAYEQRAFGHDAVDPVSGKPSDWVGLGVNILDSLDTLLLAGLKKEALRCLDWLEEIDFAEAVTEQPASFFELSIRGVGGLMGAHALLMEERFDPTVPHVLTGGTGGASQQTQADRLNRLSNARSAADDVDGLLAQADSTKKTAKHYAAVVLDKAKALARLMLAAAYKRGDTALIPAQHLDLKHRQEVDGEGAPIVESKKSSHTVSLADAGSVQMEFRDLAFWAKNVVFETHADRALKAVGPLLGVGGEVGTSQRNT